MNSFYNLTLQERFPTASDIRSLESFDSIAIAARHRGPSTVDFLGREVVGWFEGWRAKPTGGASGLG